MGALRIISKAILLMLICNIFLAYAADSGEKKTITHKVDKIVFLWNYRYYKYKII